MTTITIAGNGAYGTYNTSWPDPGNWTAAGSQVQIYTMGGGARNQIITNQAMGGAMGGCWAYTNNIGASFPMQISFVNNANLNAVQSSTSNGYLSVSNGGSSLLCRAAGGENNNNNYMSGSGNSSYYISNYWNVYAYYTGAYMGGNGGTSDAYTGAGGGGGAGPNGAGYNAYSNGTPSWSGGSGNGGYSGNGAWGNNPGSNGTAGANYNGGSSGGGRGVVPTYSVPWSVGLVVFIYTPVPPRSRTGVTVVS